MPTYVAFDLSHGVFEDRVHNFEGGVIHVNDCVCCKGVGFKVFLHDLLDAVIGVGVVEEMVDSTILHFRHMCDKPEHACETSVVVVDVNDWFCSLQDTGIICVDTRKRANIPVVGDGERKLRLRVNG